MKEMSETSVSANELLPPNVMNFQALVSSTQSILKKFQNCQNHGTKNEFISTQIREIKVYGGHFRQITEESIVQSTLMALYASDLIEYVDFCLDNQNDVHDVWVGARELLNQAKNNHKKSKELLDQYRKLTENLNKTQDDLREYKPIIHDTEDLIKLNENTLRTKREDLDENIENAERHWQNVKLGATVAIIGGAVVVIALPGVALSIAIAEGLLATSGTITVGSSVAAFLQTLFAKKNEENAAKATTDISQLIEDIQKQKELVNQSIITIDSLTENLRHIICDLGEFEVFWGSEVTKLESLIEKLDKCCDGDGDDDFPMSKFVAKTVKNKWRTVEDECKQYGTILRTVITQSRIENTQ
ncbi:hypothetical protein G9A89_001004 [Geosiphon pyriformis]|nr:hypothetical protein G9A89_001004 [Geosiphon pyriformis]